MSFTVVALPGEWKLSNILENPPMPTRSMFIIEIDFENWIDTQLDETSISFHIK